jgi:hypothetical protein
LILTGLARRIQYSSGLASIELFWGAGSGPIAFFMYRALQNDGDCGHYNRSGFSPGWQTVQ